MLLKELVSRCNVIRFKSRSKRFGVASFFFLESDDSRGEWIFWDDIANHYHKSDEYDSAQAKRMIYDAVIAINNASNSALGFSIIELDGRERYKVIM